MVQRRPKGALRDERIRRAGALFLEFAGLLNAVTIHQQIGLALHACGQAREEFAEGFRWDRSFVGGWLKGQA